MISTTIDAKQAAHIKAIRNDYHEAIAFTGPGRDAPLVYLLVPSGTAEKIVGILEAAEEAEKPLRAVIASAPARAMIGGAA